jgi:hypothetical protein
MKLAMQKVPPEFNQRAASDILKLHTRILEECFTIFVVKMKCKKRNADAQHLGKMSALCSAIVTPLVLQLQADDLDDIGHYGNCLTLLAEGLDSTIATSPDVLEGCA